jgi:Asp-tRNA(Asn)/Glu-tRNA(Gln) amidotransferase C subunit
MAQQRAMSLRPRISHTLQAPRGPSRFMSNSTPKLITEKLPPWRQEESNSLEKPSFTRRSVEKRLNFPIDVKTLLSKPTWSVKALLPEPTKAPSVSTTQLRHLLRLSALPEPKNEEEEEEMLNTLSSQLHFVEHIQNVDTTGVEPLRAIRDETKAAEKETEITLDTLKEALAQEEVIGKFYKRIHRNQERPSPPDNPKGWRPLDHAKSKVGKYFVVESGQAPPR